MQSPHTIPPKSRISEKRQLISLSPSSSSQKALKTNPSTKAAKSLAFSTGNGLETSRMSASDKSRNGHTSPVSVLLKVMELPSTKLSTVASKDPEKFAEHSTRIHDWCLRHSSATFQKLSAGERMFAMDVFHYGVIRAKYLAAQSNYNVRWPLPGLISVLYEFDKAYNAQTAGQKKL